MQKLFSSALFALALAAFCSCAHAQAVAAPSPPAKLGALLTALKGGTTAKVQTAVLENVATPASGAATTLFTATGAGVVRSVWVTINAGTNPLGYDSRLQVYTDGKSAPDFDVDLGTLFLTHLDAHLTGTKVSTTYIHGQSGPNNGQVDFSN